VGLLEPSSTVSKANHSPAEVDGVFLLLGILLVKQFFRFSSFSRSTQQWSKVKYLPTFLLWFSHE
jgi:hypothetical protein